jgi:hypothetical protein
MTINIIGCGKTAQHWNGMGNSIGVNDCFRYGFHPDYLIILNTPNQFTPDRMEFIKKTSPKQIFSNSPSAWSSHLKCDVEPFNSAQWANSNKIKKQLFHSKTSPFAAISLAHTWGFKDIILWGVDFVDHKTYKPGEGSFLNEYVSYKTFTEALKNDGVNVYLGHVGSSLDFLPIYK